MLKPPEGQRMHGSILAAAIVGLLLSTGGLAVAADARPQPGQSTSTAKTESKSVIEEIRAKPESVDYAQREASSKNLEHFEGGHAGVYIGGSTLVVVLLIVLIVLLV